jgi:predicted hydrolase (HD superfamily)
MFVIIQVTIIINHTTTTTTTTNSTTNNNKFPKDNRTASLKFHLHSRNLEQFCATRAPQD